MIPKSHRVDSPQSRPLIGFDPQFKTLSFGIGVSIHSKFKDMIGSDLTHGDIMLVVLKFVAETTTGAGLTLSDTFTRGLNPICDK
jgi:hypothetical protein